MAYVSTDFTQVGKILKEDVYNEYGLLLVAAGQTLTSNDIVMLQRHKVSFIPVYDEPEQETNSQFPEQVEQLIRHEKEFGLQYGKVLNVTKQLFDEVANGYVPPLNTLLETFSPLLEQSLKQTNIYSYLHAVDGAMDYTYRHSINVGMMSALIAKLMNMPTDQVILMGQAGILHDIGKVKMPQEILMKPGKLTEEEFAVMKQHPIVGHEILSKIDGVSDVVLHCALYHHERLDGSGYPHGLTEEQIPIEAQIMAVADMYDAILSDRVYKSRTSPFEAAHILWENAFNGKLNGKIVSRFVNYLLSLYVGCRAELQDGREVEVVLIHNNEPLRPLVKIVGGDYIDLRQHRHLNIQKFLA